MVNETQNTTEEKPKDEKHSEQEQKQATEDSESEETDESSVCSLLIIYSVFICHLEIK